MRSPRNLSIGITNDPVDELDETVIVTLTPSTGYEIGSQNVHTLTIVDEDDPEVLPLSFVATIPNQSLVMGVPIEEVVLPYAVGGTPPYRYALSPDLPAGLELDAQTLRGTPSESRSATTYTYTVTDDEEATARQTFTIEVAPPPELAFADLIADQMYPVGNAIAEVILPRAMGGVPPYIYAVTLDLSMGITFDSEPVRSAEHPPR